MLLERGCDEPQEVPLVASALDVHVDGVQAFVALDVHGQPMEQRSLADPPRCQQQYVVPRGLVAKSRQLALAVEEVRPLDPVSYDVPHDNCRVV